MRKGALIDVDVTPTWWRSGRDTPFAVARLVERALVPLAETWSPEFPVRKIIITRKRIVARVRIDTVDLEFAVRCKAAEDKLAGIFEGVVTT